MKGSSVRGNRLSRRPGGGRRSWVAIWVVAAVAALVVSVVPAQASDSSRSSGRGSASLWRSVSAMPTASRGAGADVSALRYHALTLNRVGMKGLLAGAPLEFTAAARTRPLIVSLPAPAGGFARFAVQESPVVAPELAARFPFVKTYNGQGIDDPAATIRLDLGRTGFHAQVLSPSGDWYIDPYYHLDQSARRLPPELIDSHGPFIKYDPDDNIAWHRLWADGSVVALIAHDFAVAADAVPTHGVPLVQTRSSRRSTASPASTSASSPSVSSWWPTTTA
jgi:hypothetical protein